MIQPFSACCAAAAWLLLCTFDPAQEQLQYCTVDSLYNGCIESHEHCPYVNFAWLGNITVVRKHTGPYILCPYKNTVSTLNVFILRNQRDIAHFGHDLTKFDMSVGETGASAVELVKRHVCN